MCHLTSSVIIPRCCSFFFPVKRALSMHHQYALGYMTSHLSNNRCLQCMRP
jgi:hypothetical protein